MFTDRDGKFQLLSLAESAFDPLSRTTRFMLTEEAHHMFVGETGISRTVERTCQLLKEMGGVSEDVRKMGGIDLPTIQKHLNQWFSLSLDLFGGEVSSNAASYFANGLKGRVYEDKYEDHKILDSVYNIDRFEDGQLKTEEVPMRNALNEIHRDAYIYDCEKGLKRWNKVLEKHGLSDRLYLPHRRFNRQTGLYAGHNFDPTGNPLTEEKWNKEVTEWLPSEEDHRFISSLQVKAVYDPDKMASWIAPPRRGVNDLPVNYEYVRAEE
jgi:benzoyl-CoA 2,3-dioxygenase component B